MKTFVTGATGLLGNNLVRALRARGADVVCLVRSEAKAQRLLGDTGATWVVGDMSAPEKFADALEGCDVVFHTAAYFREYYQPGDHAAALENINVRGTLTLMDLADARGIKKFVHTSSSGTIGAKPDGSPGDEESAPSDFAIENLYFRSKVTGETKIRAFVPAHGMQIIEILPGWMWGPGDEAPTAAGQLAKDFLARKLPAIPPGGANVVDARDVAAAMIECVDHAHHGARYVVAGPEKTIADVVASLERVSGIRGPRLRVPYLLALVVACFSELRAWMTKRPALITRMGLKTMNRAARVSSARAQRELGVTFRPFDETARDVIAWYRSAQPV